MSKALWHTSTTTSVLRSVSQPPNLQTGDIKVTACYSMISTGTERSVCTGRVPVSCYERMAVPFMGGDFQFPVKYGYALIGQLDDGRAVHLLHPHQEHCYVREENLYFLPKDLPLDRATLISNMETVINAYWDSEVKANDSIVIFGFGNIAALLAVTLRKLVSPDITIVERDAWRAGEARRLGFKVSGDPQVMSFEMAFNTTGNAGALNQALKTLKTEGKLIELSWFTNQEVGIKLGEAFHYNRLSIISSQVSIIPLKMQSAYDYKKRKDLAVELLKDPVYDQVISHIIPFESSPDFFNRLRNNQLENGLIWLIKY